jgi:thioredoxin reductase
MTNVAIVGAGPYALSLAAYLRRHGVDHRIFGQPMQFWRQIAEGAKSRFLKSFGFGTNIYTPEEGYSFTEYCLKRGLESFEPCTMSSFAHYGVWVQQQIIPDVEPTHVIDVSPTQGGYRIVLSSEEEVSARNVVIATGLTSYAILPPQLARLPDHLVQHTSKVNKFESLKGREICVVGAGQSALEAAMLLHEAGARPRLLIRGPRVEWNKRIAQKRTFWHKLRSPISALGTGPKAWVFSTFPSATHFVPEKWRLSFLDGYLPPHGAWWLRDLVEGEVPIDLNCMVTKVREVNGRVGVQVHDRVNGSRELICDQVIAGTGFEVDVDRLSFLSTELRASVRRIGRAPRLNRHFETSAPGLFFVGPAAVKSFGPLFRFVHGASYAAPALAAHLAKSEARGSKTRSFDIVAKVPGIKNAERQRTEQPSVAPGSR